MPSRVTHKVSYLDHKIGPLGTECVRLERVGYIGAVKDELHDEDAVLVVSHAVDHVLAASAEGLGVLAVYLQEHL